MLIKKLMTTEKQAKNFISVQICEIISTLSNRFVMSL